MKYRFIQSHEKAWPVSVMCRVLGVARSGYYAWLRRPESARKRANRALVVEIKAIHQKSRETYGSPRIHAVLRRKGYRCSRKRVARLMRLAGLRSKSPKKFKATTDSAHSHPVAANLLERDFEVRMANEVWLADITYIWTREGWLYLAAVLDLFSRRIVGWALDARMKADLACKALSMGINRRQPAPGLIHHSDRGSQYASKIYQKLLKRNQIVPSMSRKGNCWDNAPMESFFHTLKVELVHHRNYRTREEARREIIEYMEMFYNTRRLHSSLDYSTPAEHETMRLAITA
jgi:transposase InsO family protein